LHLVLVLEDRIIPDKAIDLTDEARDLENASLLRAEETELDKKVIKAIPAEG